jgi:carboxypeptidase PM20D1
MLKKILRYLLLLVLLLISVLVINTILQKGDIPATKASEVPTLSDSAAMHLSEAIQIKTVSFGDTLPIDTAEFVRFRTFLEHTYPLVHQQLPRKEFNQFSYVYTWKGKDTTLPPYVLMAHMDVVPVEPAAESKWTVPSFGGVIKNDTIWGRGAVDDKVSVIAILEAVESALQKNYVPDRTIYLSFGHDEEVSGKRGAKNIGAWFQENKIKPALVLDEGGQIDREHFKRFNRPVAVIGTGEKGYLNLDLTVELPGGHSSMPSPETAIDILNKALVNVRAQQMPAHLTPALSELIQRTKGAESFGKQMVLSNLWLFKSLVLQQMAQTKETNAMTHTTIVPTIIHSGIKDNVIPSIAKATINSRILPGETSDDVLNFIVKAIHDDRVKVVKQPLSIMEPSPITDFNNPAFKKVENIIYQSVPDVIVSPYIVVGGTDSKYFRNFSDAVLNFAAVQDVKGFHGIDERIGITDLHRTIHFYSQLIQSTK